MENNKLYGMIGLAKRAGRIVSGTDAVIDSVRAKNAHLVIISEDVSEATAKRLTDKCKFYNVGCIIYGSMESMGRAIGKDFCASVSITDEGFADSILHIYNNLTEVAFNGSN